MASEKSDLHVPPEESPHELTFMQWPVSRRVYFDGAFLAKLQKSIAEIANTISEFEPVIMLADHSAHQHARSLLSEKVELWDIATEDLWCRDSGPLFAFTPDDELVVSHIQFNGWGGKQIHERDGKVAEKVARRLGIKTISSGVTGEAGGVEHDGHGLLIAHESSWVIENRNAGLSRTEIEKRLMAAYGASQLIWSPGLKGADITDYHIDSLARFTGPARVLLNLPKTPDPADPFHQAAQDTLDTLKGAGLDVEVIYEPEIRRERSLDFVASYVNYYACNGAIIAAQFG
ncbi:MAG: agmatine deiminase family protein, partial [Pseudomonadota bacterium]